MRVVKKNQEAEEAYEDDNTNNNTIIKEGKSSDEKANAMRSKHSVTEQRRRSKINERFQILRDRIPHSEQKKDTASFLLEVIEYVQFLQEKVQKYEGPYQGWSPEATKLMPWRNSHWRVQSFVGHPQSLNYEFGQGATFSGKFDESDATMLTNAQDPLVGDATCRPIDHFPELAKPMSLQTKTLASDAQSIDCSTTGDTLNPQEDLVIDGGTISISSVYSQELLNTLTQSLQNAGVDLSQAKISVQIDLGKQANRRPASRASIWKDYENPPSTKQILTHPREASSEEDPNQSQKRPKI